MATPVLPYPNMDFTPLDILTAAEMDQMVANDQYLRDFCAGLADGTNLSDGVIQARKLDSSTLPGLIKCVISARISGNNTIQGGAIIPLENQDNRIGDGIAINSSGQFVIGSGVSYILAFASWTCAPETSGFRRVHIRKNGSMTNAYAFTTTDVASGYLNGSTTGVLLNVNEGDIIDLYNRETTMVFWTGTGMTLLAF